MGEALLFGALVLGALVGPSADDVSQDEPQTIIVTGERTKRTLKQTPSSVAVFDRHDIDGMAAPDRFQQLLQIVPNVLIPTSRDAPNIRGQSGVGVLTGLPAFLGGARPRTVMQIDGRTATFNEFANSSEGLWDVDHVEVFRSPQTTTQGVNSIAGAIFIHTADPTYAWEGRARTIVGQSHRRQGSAMVSGPLAGDELAFRISADMYRSLASTRMTGPVAGVDDINPDRYWTARAKILAEPHAVPGLKVLAIYAHTNSQAPQAEFAQPPFRKRRDDNYIFGYFRSDVDSVTAQVTYSVTSAIQSRTTLSSGRSHFHRFAPPGFGQTEIHASDRALETVLDWRPDGAMNAIGGASFQGVALNQFINLERANLGTGSFQDRQTSAGLYGEFTWRPAHRISLTAGARYQTDGKRRSGVLRMSPDLPLDYDAATHAFLPKMSAAYDLNADLVIGVMVQRAYNPGGVTLDPAHRRQLEFRPEYLWDYEAFVRGSLLGGLASVTGNLFYNDINDAQRELDFDLSSPGGQVGLLQIVSEPQARVYGAELDIAAILSSRLTLRVASGLLNTRITNALAPSDPYLGKEFAGAPHFTESAAVDWAPIRNLRFTAQLRHNSAYFQNDANDPLFRTTGWSVLDGRITWERGRLAVFGYGQNLLNRFHLVGWSAPLNRANVNASLAEPREAGVGVDAHF